MMISVVNHSKKVKDSDLQTTIRAINRQVAEDFAPYWGMSAKLRLEGRSESTPEKETPADLRGDAILYLWDEADVADALGYHDRNARGIPFGFVFTSIAEALKEPWSVTLSHETLELIADPEANLLVMGPHPSEERTVFHWLEMCDAVQDETYEIDGVEVSNFVLPLYFTGTRLEDEAGARNDFLGTVTKGKTLTSFGINPGGYIGFYDPDAKQHSTVMRSGDKRAQERLNAKSAAKKTRRSLRYGGYNERLTIARQATSVPRLAAASRPKFETITAQAEPAPRNARTRKPR